MVGRVFISCGQKNDREKEIADKIGILLQEKFSLDSYIAIKVQGLNDIMRITQELKTCDYYLFIDFLRNEKIPISLFTHQEFALAHHLGFTDMIAFQEVGCPNAGFLRYVQSNPESFNDDTELLAKVEAFVRQRGWNKNFSRNLVLEDIEVFGPYHYNDHTGSSFARVWQVRIRNRRPEVAAINTVCILDSIEHNGKTEPCSDRSTLKWARQIGYQRTILPEDQGKIDAFAVTKIGIYLHSALDEIPRQPIVVSEGKYRFNFKMFSENLPLLSFALEVDYVKIPLDSSNELAKVKIVG